MNTNNKKEWERVALRSQQAFAGHYPLAEDEAIIEADKKIKQLEQENTELKLYIDAHLDAKVHKERDALKAHCEKLQVAVKAGYEPHMNYIHQLDCTSDELLSQTPAQSLAEIQAQAIEEMLNNVTEQHGRFTDTYYFRGYIQQYAKQIREGEKYEH